MLISFQFVWSSREDLNLRPSSLTDDALSLSYLTMFSLGMQWFYHWTTLLHYPFLGFCKGQFCLFSQTSSPETFWQISFSLVDQQRIALWPYQCHWYVLLLNYKPKIGPGWGSCTHTVRFLKPTTPIYWSKPGIGRYDRNCTYTPFRRLVSKTSAAAVTPRSDCFLLRISVLSPQPALICGDSAFCF